METGPVSVGLGREYTVTAKVTGETAVHPNEFA
jgi:hypothetical protein